MKNQLKKSLSLIMAILMLMSCWVWVAPTEAEAATQNYSVTVKYTINNKCEEGGHVRICYWSFNADGTLNKTEAGYVDAGGDLKNVAEGSYEKTVSVAGFPYKVEVYASGTSTTDGEIGLQAVTVGNRVVTGQFDNYNVKDNTKHLGINTSGGKDGDMWGDFTPDWPFPKFGLDEQNSDTTLDITTIPGSATASFAFKDINYDTAWPHTVTQNTPSVVLQKDGLAKTGMSASKGTGTSTTVSAAAGADRYNPGNSDSAWTLKASFTSGGVTVYPVVDVNLTHPSYTVSFDGNGGKLDASDAAAISGVYGTAIGHYPTTYDYKGFQLAGYSTSQTGGTVLGEDAFKATLITGNQTYYARWEPKDVDAVFLTADGQTVCTLTAIYNKTLIITYLSSSKISRLASSDATSNRF